MKWGPWCDSQHWQNVLNMFHQVTYTYGSTWLVGFVCFGGHILITWARLAWNSQKSACLSLWVLGLKVFTTVSGNILWHHPEAYHRWKEVYCLLVCNKTRSHVARMTLNNWASCLHAKITSMYHHLCFVFLLPKLASNSWSYYLNLSSS